MKRPMLNPIVSKEFRSRMRSWKSPLAVSLYLGLLGLITAAFYWLQQKNMLLNGFGPDVGPQIYVLLTTFQLLLLCFVTPAFTAGVINGEKERQTFDLLLCTRLSAASIVCSKLLAAISYMILLVLASLPIFGIVYFFGGVLLADIGRVFAVYLTTALTLGVVGIFCSALFRRTQVSMVVSYVVVFFMLLGTVVIASFMRGMQAGRGPDQYLPFIAYLNPLVALFSIFPTQGPGVDIINQFLRLGVSYPAAATGLLSPWQYNFIIDGVIVVILLTATIISIDRVGRFQWIKGIFRRKASQIPAPVPAGGAVEDQ